MKFIRTNQNNSDFQNLVDLLNKELSICNGDDHAFYNHFNGIENLNNVIVIYQANKPIACGAIKHFDKGIVEIKRMYTLSNERRKGIAGIVLNELEVWAKELGNHQCVLETGKNLVGAVAMYKNKGYVLMPKYKPYENIDNSLCFSKNLG